MPQSEEPSRSDMSHRTNRCPNHRLQSDFHWYRPENPNPASFGDASASNNSATAFVPRIDTHPAVVTIEPQQPPISPDVLIYDPNVQPNPNIDSNDIQNTTQGNDAVPLNPPNNSTTNSATRHQSTSRCPYYRRLSMSGYHNMPSNYHSSLQNGNGYLRPAYAPHESLWYRQQNNQEIHRRHMMNNMSGTGVANDTTQPSPFGPYPCRGTTSISSISNNGFCTQCDQQHPIGHPHRRLRQYVCGLNLVSRRLTKRKKLELRILNVCLFFTELGKSTTFDCNAVCIHLVFNISR